MNQCQIVDKLVTFCLAIFCHLIGLCCSPLVKLLAASLLFIIICICFLLRVLGVGFCIFNLNVLSLL